MAEEKIEVPVGIEAPKDNTKILFGLLILNMVFIIGVGVIVLLAQKKDENTQSLEKVAQGSVQSTKSSEAKEGKEGGAKGEGVEGGEKGLDIDARFYNIGDFTANLNGPGTSHYVRLNVNLELAHGLDEQEMKRRTPQIRDKIITLLNSKRPQDLQNSEGRAFLKEEIKTSINPFLQSGKISGVYFSTFVFE